jgi:RHS repeat-associated protein
MSRLTQAKTTVGGSDDFQYAYDKASNRTKQVANGTTTFYGYGTGNELCWSKVTTTDPGSACATPSGATTYSHDANGNLTGSSAGFAATYNPLDQATSITGAGGSTLSPMTYGGSHQTERRRAGTTNFTDSALGLQVAAPTGGGAGTYYTRDPNGNLLSQRTPSGTHYYVLDALGSVVALTNSSGSVVGRYAYEPYGKPTHSGTVTSSFQFASGHYDSQTKLVKFGARYYDPTPGRWTQQDALAGSLANPKTLNRYAYAGCEQRITDPFVIRQDNSPLTRDGWCHGRPESPTCWSSLLSFSCSERSSGAGSAGSGSLRCGRRRRAWWHGQRTRLDQLHDETMWRLKVRVDDRGSGSRPVEWWK